MIKDGYINRDLIYINNMYKKGYSIKEISDIMEISTSEVKECIRINQLYNDSKVLRIRVKVVK